MVDFSPTESREETIPYSRRTDTEDKGVTIVFSRRTDTEDKSRMIPKTTKHNHEKLPTDAGKNRFGILCNKVDRKNNLRERTCLHGD